MASGDELRAILTEGLQGIVGQGQPVGARTPSRELPDPTVYAEGNALYNSPVFGSGAWKFATRGQLAIPSPYSRASSRGALSDAPWSLDAGERSWQAALEQTRANNPAPSPGILSGPEFDQPNLPGMGTGAEQMSLFKTRTMRGYERDSLYGDNALDTDSPTTPATTRWAYHTSPDAADWVDSKSQEEFDLSSQIPPDNSFGFGKRYYDADDRSPDIVPGTRDHINAIDTRDSAWAAFTEGTDGGDLGPRKNPVQFDELDWDDDGSNYAAYTPDGTQAVGFDYDEWDDDGLRRAMISGAGTGSLFAGNKFGMRGAIQFAQEKNAEGVLAHGNSFTDAGQAAFGNRGALTEGEVDERLYAAEESGRDVYAEELGWLWDEHYADEFESDFIERTGGEFDRHDLEREMDLAREQYVDSEKYNYDARADRARAGEEMIQEQRDLLQAVSGFFGGARDRGYSAAKAVQESMIDAVGNVKSFKEDVKPAPVAGGNPTLRLDTSRRYKSVEGGRM